MEIDRAKKDQEVKGTGQTPPYRRWVVGGPDPALLGGGSWGGIGD